jgi:H+/Cl- antiporter ClcA
LTIKLVDATTAIIGAVIAGIAGGFLSSWMKFNATGEKFDGRKHGNALITGALTGMGLGLLLVVANDITKVKEISNAVYAVGVFFIFLAAAGVDAYRSKASKMIHKNKPPATATTTPPTPTTTTGEVAK